MKFTVADLLDQLPAQEALPLTKLEKALGISQKAEKQQLQIGLDGLSRLGLLEVSEAGVARREAEGTEPVGHRSGRDSSEQAAGKDRRHVESNVGERYGGKDGDEGRWRGRRQ